MERFKRYMASGQSTCFTRNTEEITGGTATAIIEKINYQTREDQ